MSKIYFADCDSDELSHRILNLIQVKRDDKLITHFKQSFLMNDQFKTSGNMEGNTFRIWVPRSPWSGIFYPVLIGQATKMENGIQVELKTKMNSLIHWPFYAIAAILMYGIFSGIVIQDNNEIRFLIPRMAVSALLFVLILALPVVILKNTEKELMQKVALELNLKKAL